MQKHLVWGVICMIASCTGRSRSVEPEPAAPLPNTSPTTQPPVVADEGPDLGTTPGDLTTSVFEEPDLTTLTGLTESQLEEGALYVGAWSGIEDEVPEDVLWHVKSVRGSANATGVEEEPVAPVNPNPATPSPGASAKDEVVFRIPAGTGEGDWNTQDTEVVLKVGVKFVIINDDDRVHQWHTNGTPCPHGKQIPPGGRDECTPSEAFEDGPLYDHISRGKFYVRAER